MKISPGQTIRRAGETTAYLGIVVRRSISKSRPFGPFTLFIDVGVDIDEFVKGRLSAGTADLRGGAHGRHRRDGGLSRG